MPSAIARAIISPFSPLIIGEWTATSHSRRSSARSSGPFQSPNHRGVDCNGRIWMIRHAEFSFQSPNHRGVDCNGEGMSIDGSVKSRFQSPNHRGVDCNPSSRMRQSASITFQSPNHRGVDCNRRLGEHGARVLRRLSVP